TYEKQEKTKKTMASSEVEREANRQRCRRGAAEKPNTDIGPEGGVDGPRWTRGAAGT
ncbi:hypothetical protein THAOC_00559, partial [Thalassiosira oceanica]